MCMEPILNGFLLGMTILCTFKWYLRWICSRDLMINAVFLDFDKICSEPHLTFFHYTANKYWLVVSTPLKNMLVSWDDYSQYMEKQKWSKPPTRIWSHYKLFLLVISARCHDQKAPTSASWERPASIKQQVGIGITHVLRRLGWLSAKISHDIWT